VQDGRATIFAPASGLGRAAIAVLRISGPAASLVAERLAGVVPAPRRATIASLRGTADTGPIDQALLLFFPGPASFTGEDVLEVQHHGGVAIARALLETLSAMPELRPAEPGEFSKRAFLNGKLDLTQAEGLADLIDATTRAQARAALRQLSGGQGQVYAGWREQLLRALAMLEAEIDFSAEDEVPEAMWRGLAPSLSALLATIGRHLDDGHKGERLREGLTVAVVGAPNVGKSSLVNVLARRDVAIVTPLPGTTRDVIEVALELDGLPLTLLDTAGLRDSDDPVEREGIARARSRAALADLRLWVVDHPAHDSVVEDGEIAAAAGGAAITVLNKADLWPNVHMPAGVIRVSALTGEGLDDLLAALSGAARQLLSGSDSGLITRSRHRTALEAAHGALQRALALGSDADLGLLAEELRLAARAIGRITGAIAVEEILDRVFGTFCIGK
jgi:tRNA modification GTPase